MYINAVLSFLGAWKIIEQDHPNFISDIELALAAAVQPRRTKRSKELYRENIIDYSDFSKRFSFSLEQSGWQREVRISRDKRTFRYMALDAIKDEIGVEIVMGKRAFAESLIFTRFPLFVLAKKIKVATLLVPMASLARTLPTGIGSFFEAIHEVLSLAPIPLKYPFAVLGFETQKAEERQIINLTSDLDEYLITELNHPLNELLLIHEMEDYDFKEKVSDSGKLKETICAFANLPNGGLFIIGVSDDGLIPGLPKGKVLDNTKLGISNILDSGKFLPKPILEMKIFDAPNDPSRSVLTVKVKAVHLTPCMLDGRIYVRSGPSTRLATPQDVRKILSISV